MNRISTTQLWVHDQDEALEFWTKKVGWQITADVTVPEMGNFRWLAVAPEGQDVSVVLMAIPPAPIMDPTSQGQVRELMGKGYAGTVFLTTEDCLAEVARLKARGVEFTEEPSDRPYGLDAAFRDPSGNSIRLAQLRPIG
ncbi:MAG: VOC family protein [Chloroflexota bacterium]